MIDFCNKAEANSIAGVISFYNVHVALLAMEYTRIYSVLHLPSAFNYARYRYSIYNKG